MRALVLGANGQLGRALVEAAPAGVEVVALDRGNCDIADQDRVERTITEARPAAVFNAAAYTAVDRAESEPEIATRLNGAAAGWIARAARSVGAKLVHVSTDYVFDGFAGHAYRPGDKVGPLSVYGQSKLKGEQAVAAADPDALIVRTAWVYAANGANFLNTMLRLMRERDSVAVVSDQIGTPTYAASLASALWSLQRLGASGIHHFTDAGVASWYDFAVAIAEEGYAAGLLDRVVFVRPITTADYPTPARRPNFAVLDKTLTWRALGEAAPHWRVNLRAAVNELRNNV
jgi:dTDP-4-dehydrorhamnose reductase